MFNYDPSNHQGSVIIHDQMIRFVGQPMYWRQLYMGKWDAAIFNVLDKYLNKQNTFVDIGAWNGSIALYAARLCKQVYATEPDPVAFHILDDNVNLNLPYFDTKNILLAPFAISNANRSDMLYCYEQFGNSKSSLMPRKENGEGVSVFSAKLDDYFANQKIELETLGLVKIDAEGAEARILTGAGQWIMKNLPAMVVKFHPYWYEDFDSDIKALKDIIFKYPFVKYSDALKFTEKDFDLLNKEKKTYELLLSQKD